MNPRSFLQPRALEVSPPPRPGGPAPPLPPSPDGRPCVVAFLRHVGCPFAERTFRDLRELAEGDTEVEWAAVSHAPEAATGRWCDAVGGAGRVVVIVDEERTVYAAWGLGLTRATHFLGGRSLAGVARLAREGIRNRHAEGTRWQSAGTFGVDAGGIVRFAHVPEHAADLPDLRLARASVLGR